MIMLLLSVSSAQAEDVLGRVISVYPKKRQVVVAPLNDQQETFSLTFEGSPSIRPGDLVRLKASKGPRGRLVIKGLRSFPPDKTGVRRRLKMRRALGVKRRR